MHDLQVEALRPAHDRTAFDCGTTALNHYLQRQASQDVKRRVAQIFVAVSPASPSVVVGYYGLSAASIDRDDLPEEIIRRLPLYPVPAVRLGRLAVDSRYQGKGVGDFLLLDAFNRILGASVAIGIHAIVVDAKNEIITRFYSRYGFRPFPRQPLRLFMPLATVAASGL